MGFDVTACRVRCPLTVSSMEQLHCRSSNASARHTGLRRGRNICPGALLRPKVHTIEGLWGGAVPILHI